jgi:methionine synthase I (cobalamin-dependent)
VISLVRISQVITANLFQERGYSTLINTANTLIFGVNTQGAVKVWNFFTMRLVGVNCGIGRSRHSSLPDLVSWLRFLYVGCHDN